MKKSAIFLYLLVLIISLCVAYYTWTGEKEQKTDKRVTIVDCAGRDLTSLVIQAKNRTVEYTQRKSQVSANPYWWVNTTSTIPPPVVKPQKKDVPDTKGPAKPEGQEPRQPAEEKPAVEAASGQEVKTRLEVFKGNKGLGEQIEKLCPFEALRAFGAISEEKLKEFGIIGSEERLILDFRGQPREFVFGTTSYGQKDRYLQDSTTKEVYLVSGQLIKDLNYPKSRFMERSLHQFEKDKVVRLQISTGEAQKELLHRKEEDQKKDFWVDSKSPDKENELYSNWVNKLWQLSPIDYLAIPEAETKACAFPQDAVYVSSFLFFSQDRELGFMKIFKGKDEKGNPDYYACSENTEAVVKLSRSQIESLLKDLEDVMGKS